MLFSFVIPTVDDSRIRNIINSLFFSDGWSYNDCELIIIVNNCPKSFYKRIRNDFLKLVNSKYINLLFLEKTTIGGARNEGIKKTQGKYIIHLDSDCVIRKDYVVNLRKHVKNNNFLVAKGLVEFISSKGLISRANCELKNLTYSSRKHVCYTPNLIVRRSLYEKVGLFDTKGVYGEDTDWSLRLESLLISPLFLKNLVVKHFDFTNNFRILIGYFYYGEARFCRFEKKITNSKKLRKKIFFTWKIFDEIPNLRTIHYFDYKLCIVLFYLIRNIGVINGFLKWKIFKKFIKK